MKLAKEANKTYEPEVFENGDTLKQLLARSRYLLFKRKHKWTPSQEMRAKILFEQFPDLKKAYKLSMKLAYIFDNTYDKGVAFTKLARWYQEVEKNRISNLSDDCQLNSGSLPNHPQLL